MEPLEQEQDGKRRDKMRKAVNLSHFNKQSREFSLSLVNVHPLLSWYSRQTKAACMLSRLLVFASSSFNFPFEQNVIRPELK